MWCRPTCVALAVLVLLAFGRAEAAIIQSGFNDVTGINSDGIANNSPFNINSVSLGGQGSAEPGWAGPWRLTTGFAGVDRVAFEGDGGAAFFSNTGGATRVFGQPTADRFSVELRLMIPGSITRSVLFRVSDNSIQDPFLGIGVQWLVSPDREFIVLDGIEDGCPTGMCPLLNTGLFLTPGVWHLVRVEIDLASRNWEFLVDGVRFDSPNPLGFRGRPMRLDGIEFLNEIAAPDGSYIDAVVVNTDIGPASAVPEPSSLAVLTVAVLGLAARGATRRRVIATA